MPPVLLQCLLNNICLLSGDVSFHLPVPSLLCVHWDKQAKSRSNRRILPPKIESARAAEQINLDDKIAEGTEQTRKLGKKKPLRAFPFFLFFHLVAPA